MLVSVHWRWECVSNTSHLATSDSWIGHGWMSKEHYPLQLSRHCVLVDTRMQVPGLPHRCLRSKRSRGIHRSCCRIRPGHEAGQLENGDLAEDQEKNCGRAIDPVDYRGCSEYVTHLTYLFLDYRPLGCGNGRPRRLNGYGNWSLPEPLHHQTPHTKPWLYAFRTLPAARDWFVPLHSENSARHCLCKLPTTRKRSVN